MTHAHVKIHRGGFQQGRLVYAGQFEFDSSLDQDEIFVEATQAIELELHEGFIQTGDDIAIREAGRGLNRREIIAKVSREGLQRIQDVE